MDRRALIAIVVVGLIWAVWAAIFYPKKKQSAEDATPTGTELASGSPMTTGIATTTAVGTPTLPPESSTNTTDGVATAETPTPVVTATPPPEKISTLRSENLVITFTNSGGRPVEATLEKYQVAVDNEDRVKLFADEFEEPELQPMIPQFDVQRSEGGRTRRVSLVPPDARFDVVEESDTRLVYEWAGETMSVRRVWELTGNRYQLEFSETYRNTGESPVEGRAALSWFAHLKKQKKGRGFLRRRGVTADQFNPTAYVDGRVYRRPVKNVNEPREVGKDKPVTWFGIDDRYFLTALIPVDPLAEPEPVMDTEETGVGPDVVFLKPMEKTMGLRVTRAPVTLQPGDAASYEYAMFVGPKDYDLLQEVDYHLSDSLNLGRLIGPIAKVLLVLLRWFQSWTVHWGLAIVLMTLLVKLLLLPLTHKSMKSMRENGLKMQAIQPDIDRLKSRYSEPEDKDKLNQEMMSLFQRKGVNPLSTLGGCIPMVLQMPIWFALYRVLFSDIDLRQAPLFLWVQDLSAPDPFYVLPILLGVVMFAQQRIMPQPTAGTGNQTQMKVMKYAMPVMFTFIMLNLPAGLVLYIFVNTCLSVVQSLYINKTMQTSTAAATAKT